MGTGARVCVIAGLFRAFWFCVYVHVRGGANRGEFKALGIMEGLAVIDHGGNIHPVAAVIQLGLAAGIIIIERDIEKAGFRIGGADAADPVVGDGGGMLDVNGIGFEIVRQGQDFVGIIGGAGGSIGAGGGKGAGSYTELIQIDGAGGLYVELVSGGLGEWAGADQVAVDKVIEVAARDRDPH